MGNYVNKYFSHNTSETRAIETEKVEINNCSTKDEATQQEDVMQTPPTIHKTLPADPRSVTNGIHRTPIEVNSTPVRLNRRVISAVPRHLQSKPYLETDIDKVMLCLTPKKPLAPRVVEPAKSQTTDVQNQNPETPLTPLVNAVKKRKTISAIDKERFNVLGLDPRSPAADFDRTPILMPRSLERLKARSQENLERRGSYDTDIFYPRFSYCEMSTQFNVTEIQALPDLASSAVKTLHLDSLDSEDKWNESCSSCSSKTDSFSDNGNEITIIEDSESPEPKVCKGRITSYEEELALAEKGSEEQYENPGNSEQNNCDDVFVTKSAEQKEINVNDNDIIKVWRDSLVLDKPEKTGTTCSDDTNVAQERISREPKEEVIITFDDDSIAKDTLSQKLFKCETNKTRLDTVVKKKKVLKLQDEKKAFNSNDKNGNENTKIRTPLANRSNNGQMQTLLTNSPQQILRSKRITPKMLQENTPPHKKYVAKPKLSGMQWDPDSTVII